MSKETVLIVDDDPDHRDVVKTILATCSEYSSICVSTGDLALELLFRGLRPGVVLLDVRMYPVEGEEIVKIIRESEALAQLPIVLATAKNPQEINKDVLQLVQGFLAKPYDLDDLLFVLYRASKRNQLPDQ